MKSIKNKITDVIRKSNGFPNYTRHEYLEAIRLVLNSEFTKEEITFIQSRKINLDNWIMAITKEITVDLF